MSYFRTALLVQRARKVCAVEGHVVRNAPDPVGDVACWRCSALLVRGRQ